MTAIFPTGFRTALLINPALLDSPATLQVKVRLFREAPAFNDNDVRYLGITTVTSLAAKPGWTEVATDAGYPAGGLGPVTVAKRIEPVASANNYTLLATFPLTGLGYVEVKAAVYYYNGTVGGVVNPVILITDTPFLGQQTVISGVDSIVSNPDVPNLGASVNRYLFSWATPAGNVTAVNVPTANTFANLIALKANVTYGDGHYSGPAFAVGEYVVIGDGSTATYVAGSWILASLVTPLFNPVEGLLALARGAPLFESSHTQHIWLYPNRCNLIANPGFEKDTGFWLTNKSVTRIPDPAPGSSGYWSGRFANLTGLLDEAGLALVAEDGMTLLTPDGMVADDTALVIESNTFPTQGEERWTIQLMAKGVGTLKVGFVWWDASFQETAVDWGEETWTLDPVNYVHVSVARTAYETSHGLVRLECNGSSLTIDQVLVEKGYLKDWPYFDGDTTYGARNDFSWYGGSTRQGASYSLWYNNKRAVYGRLFSRDVGGVEVVTDEVMAEQGFVYQWVPAGTVVLPHIDVLYPGDLQLPLVMRSGAVLAYRANDADLTGVPNPWP